MLLHPWTQWEALRIWTRLRNLLGLLRLLGSSSSSVKGGIIKNGLMCMIYGCCFFVGWGSSSSREACVYPRKNGGVWRMKIETSKSPKSQAQKPNNVFFHTMCWPKQIPREAQIQGVGKLPSTYGTSCRKTCPFLQSTTIWKAISWRGQCHEIAAPQASLLIAFECEMCK